ncbi:MAG: LytTR family transcriptional regulator DNA-binding domain-containing protein [Flavobacteriales bacterium]|nr:hypothetical protein [Flavobacteriales bacterium]MCC6578440.1 LytTR family transcriptional regulator DNA-binding domain-containing protein [Flavobacteriales bacterium]NUQ15095.1 LytTR family transcriptional regulator DNA-binding domain-containing protein [Flavobacteriales bacterium]
MMVLRAPLVLRTAHGPQLFDARTLLRFDAEDKYARATTTDGRRIVVLHPLSDLEERLCCGERIGDLLFARTHRSCIVALHHVSGMDKLRNLVFDEHPAAPLSKRAWQELADLLGSLRHRRP